MVFTTNKPLAAWADGLHDADLAEAIFDRVLARGRLTRTHRAQLPHPPHRTASLGAPRTGRLNFRNPQGAGQMR